MKFTQKGAEIYFPHDRATQTLSKTKSLGVAAHQDDLEIMALEGILAGFGNPRHGFTGVTLSDGAGSARDDLYAKFTDEQMRKVRKLEQKKAAQIGEYSAMIFLDHPSSAIKDSGDRKPIEDLLGILQATEPEIVYTHNLADKHPTHIGTAMRTLQAIRELPKKNRPRKLLGCEVWRDLDWLPDTDKVVFRLDQHENIASALVGVFDSQIVGGKRYDQATLGRRRAHATYHESHSVDASKMINFGMDLTPLIADDRMDVQEYIRGFIRRFEDEVMKELKKFL